MKIYRARWVLPIAVPPIRDAWVAVDEGRVVGCGAGVPPAQTTAAEPLFGADPAAIMPALVNAHTHLELSHLRGRVPPSSSFGAWVHGLIRERRHSADPFDRAIIDAARASLEDARAAGTGVIGDISNSLVSLQVLRESGTAAHVFHELLGFNVPDPGGLVRAARDRLDHAGPGDGLVRTSITAHAPYSVAPALFEEISSDLSSHPRAPSSVHLGESPEEVLFLRDGSGPIRTVLDAVGVWNPRWTPPACGPVEYVERFGLVTERLLAVHGVQLTDRELARLAAAGATVVTCPRSARWTGVGDPPISRFYGSGVRVAIGTDSLASVADLNMFTELAAVRALAPDIPARRLLESATRAGADALRFGDQFGTIEPGKRAGLLAVRVPSGVTDVEEYLVGGIEPADIRWLQP